MTYLDELFNFSSNSLDTEIKHKTETLFHCFHEISLYKKPLRIARGLFMAKKHDKIYRIF